MKNFDKIALFWNVYKYPFIPLEHTWEKVLKKFYLKNKKVLILGSTSQLVKVTDKLGGEIWVCDDSLEMIKINEIGSNKERIIYDNWLNLKGYKFDYIVGDLVLLLFSFKDKIGLLNILYDNLSPNGCIIIRSIYKNIYSNYDYLISWVKKVSKIIHILSLDFPEKKQLLYTILNYMYMVILNDDELIQIVLDEFSKYGMVSFLRYLPRKLYIEDENSYKNLLSYYKNNRVSSEFTFLEINHYINFCEYFIITKKL